MTHKRVDYVMCPVPSIHKDKIRRDEKLKMRLVDIVNIGTSNAEHLSLSDFLVSAGSMLATDLNT